MRSNDKKTASSIAARLFITVGVNRTTIIFGHPQDISVVFICQQNLKSKVIRESALPISLLRSGCEPALILTNAAARRDFLKRIRNPQLVSAATSLANIYQIIGTDNRLL
jgi:hypothetical protein